MSNREISSITSPIYEYTFPQMVAGSASNALGAIPNYNCSTSKILGASPEDATNANKVFVALLNSNPISAGTPPFPVLAIKSSQAGVGSTETYTIYFTNEIIESNFYLTPQQIKSC